MEGIFVLQTSQLRETMQCRVISNSGFLNNWLGWICIITVVFLLNVLIFRFGISIYYRLCVGGAGGPGDLRVGPGQRAPHLPRDEEASDLQVDEDSTCFFVTKFSLFLKPALIIF